MKVCWRGNESTEKLLGTKINFRTRDKEEFIAYNHHAVSPLSFLTIHTTVSQDASTFDLSDATEYLL